MYTLYTIPGSHACRSAMLMLDHKQLPYRRVEFITLTHPVAARLHGFNGGGETRTAGRRTPGLGDSVPGFAAVGIEPWHSLALRGRHRFAEYELRFELEPSSARQTLLRAKTSADFHGPKGTVYRALVIGTGGHRLAVGRILDRISRRVGSTGAAAPAT